jgi:hypothetical protein
MKQNKSVLEYAYNNNEDMCTGTQNSPKMPIGKMAEVW